MSEDLINEIEVINSIYGDDTLKPTGVDGVYSLQISCLPFPLNLQFSSDYPQSPPALLGSDTSGKEVSREESRHVVEIFKTVLGTLFEPGQVCLYDVIEEVISRTQAEQDAQQEQDQVDASTQNLVDEEFGHSADDLTSFDPPQWTLSDPVTELKSVFIAHCAPVSSPSQAKQYVQALLASDKKIRSATHNITAWRIKGENEVIYQDCDDDGETAAGGRVLHLMQLMDLWNVMVVVTRWYGGHQLGPKRFSLINAVARDAFVKAGIVDEGGLKKKGKR